MVAAVAAAVLLALWIGATRRHVGRREAQLADWEGEETAPRLWTSTASCPHCRAGAGLLSTEAGELWFTCLACGQRHRRETKA